MSSSAFTIKRDSSHESCERSTRVRTMRLRLVDSIAPLLVVRIVTRITEKTVISTRLALSLSESGLPKLDQRRTI